MKLYPAPLAMALAAFCPLSMLLAQPVIAATETHAAAASITQAEIQSLVDAAARSDDALRERAATLMARSPETANAVYFETLGLIRPEQSAMLERMLVAGGHGAPTVVGSSASAARTGISTGWLLGGAVAVGVGAAAGGGGGGGGGGSPPPRGAEEPVDEGEVALPSQPAPTPPDEPEPLPPPPNGGTAPDPGPAPIDDDSAKTLPLSSEYVFTGGYNLTYGHVAHDRGFTGEGKRIAILDSGVRSTHNELQGQIAGHYNALTQGTTATAARDSGDHGTHVAGLLVGRRDGSGSVGYAPGSQLLNVRITNNSDEIRLTDQQLAAGFAWARQNGAQYFNNSWGLNTTAAEFGRRGIETFYATTLAEWRTGAAGDNIYVWATGNEGGAQPLVFAALPQLYPELQYNWVAVTSVNSATGQFSDFANACGDAAAWCVAAPGSSITSSVNRNDMSYGTFTGTSMATPAVTGALAVISQAFPTLSNAQVVQRLFFTANKDGVYANQSLYGQGLIDLERATRPVGGLMLVSDGGEPLSLESAALVLGQPFGSANPLAGLQVMAADSLGAGFGIDLGQPIALRRFRHDTALGFARLSRRMHQEQDNLGGMAWTSNAESARLSQVRHFSGRNSLSLGQLEDLDLLDAYTGFAGHSQLHATLAAPYWLQRPGEVTSAVRQRFDAAVGTLELTASANALRQGASLGFAMPAGEFYQSTIEVGYLRGRDGLFETHGRGLFDLDRTSTTLFGGLRGQFQQGGLALSHAAYIGRSEADGKGLFGDMGPVVTSSWLLGGLYRTGTDSWGLVMQQPLRVESASSRMRLATGYIGNQFEIRQVELDLAPAGRQVNLEAFWQRPLSADSDLKLSWLGIRQPGHQAQAAPMQILMTQWQHRF